VPRFNAVRVEPHIGRVVLIALQREQMLPGLLALLLKRDAHLLSTNRIDVVLELQHGFLLNLNYAARFARWCSVDILYRTSHNVNRESNLTIAREGTAAER